MSIFECPIVYKCTCISIIFDGSFLALFLLLYASFLSSSCTLQQWRTNVARQNNSFDVTSYTDNTGSTLKWPYLEIFFFLHSHTSGCSLKLSTVSPYERPGQCILSQLCCQIMILSSYLLNNVIRALGECVSY